MTAAAHQLVGLTLTPDWLVVEKLPQSDGRTPAVFSVGYVVENGRGERAFCKALDWSSAFESENQADDLAALSNAYIFERDLLARCQQSRMDRVVHAIASGSVQVPGAMPSRVSYLIFDKADGDSRDVLDRTDEADYTVALGLVRDCAKALGQLHRGRVFHQDVKPANLLGWKQGVEWSAKLADLGRAFCEAMDSPHADHTCPGDTTWAAPELLYGWPEDRTRTRWDRQLADMFSLGSLLCFGLVRVPYGALLAMQMSPEHRWGRWQGGYEEARSLLIDAHEQAITAVGGALAEAIRDDVVDLLADMCDPICESRGRLARRRGRIESAFFLERYISRFDVLTKRHPVHSVA